MFSHNEQEEIINKFLDTIEANDMLNEYKNMFKDRNIKFDNINIALKQNILPQNAIDLIKSFDENTYEDGERYEPLEFEIDELKEKTTKQKRRIDTLDIFFLLYNFPDDKQIEKYSNTIAVYLQHYGELLMLSKEELKIKNGFTVIVKHIVETQTLH